MKICPTCDQTFNDDTLEFCLLDGARLVPTGSQPTIVIDRSGAPVRQVPPQKKNNTALVVGLTIVLVLFAVAAVGFGLMYFLGGKGNTNANLVNNANTSPTPKTSATPKPSPSPSAANVEVSPSVESSKPVSNTETDEVTPIAWNTSATTFKTDVGRTYKFECPANGTPALIWGSDIYTADSSICTAAVHAGIISLEKGGTVTIEFRPGRATYGSTVRNGITSNTYGEYPHSYVVR